MTTAEAVLNRAVLAMALHDGRLGCGLTGIVRAVRAFVHVSGVSDVSLARNVQLSEGLRVAEMYGLRTVLLLDSDMAVTTFEAALLVELSERLNRPVSAIYSASDGVPCATVLKGAPMSGETSILGVGLGALAVPVFALRNIARRTHEFTHRGTNAWAFVSAGLFYSPDGVWRWLGEDYDLCDKLAAVGNCPVVLSDVQVGHRKSVNVVSEYSKLMGWYEAIPEHLRETTRDLFGPTSASASEVSAED